MSVCTNFHDNPSISQKHISSCWWHERESQGFSKVARIHSLGLVKICTKLFMGIQVVEIFQTDIAESFHNHYYSIPNIEVSVLLSRGVCDMYCNNCLLPQKLIHYRCILYNFLNYSAEYSTSHIKIPHHSRFLTDCLQISAVTEIHDTSLCLCLSGSQQNYCACVRGFIIWG